MNPRDPGRVTVASATQTGAREHAQVCCRDHVDNLWNVLDRGGVRSAMAICGWLSPFPGSPLPGSILCPGSLVEADQAATNDGEYRGFFVEER